MNKTNFATYIQRVLGGNKIVDCKVSYHPSDMPYPYYSITVKYSNPDSILEHGFCELIVVDYQAAEMDCVDFQKATP